ncbi:TPA: hypothetical protein QDA71_001286 [Burkholderia vietnamiensis]|nr:hypothetical protein [Burkholderia vietnamiensis]HDR9210623.1 hypothetical protein [Burkholderia vietnamiensis]
MSEFAYVESSSVPDPLKAGAARRLDAVSGDGMISFVGCPMVGREIENGEIKFSFPRAVELREAFIDWMLYWGIPFRVFV